MCLPICLRSLLALSILRNKCKSVCVWWKRFTSHDLGANAKRLFVDNEVVRAELHQLSHLLRLPGGPSFVQTKTNELR